MTREEAIRQLIGLKAYCCGEMHSAENGCSIWSEDIEALNMAIAALRQQPVTNCHQLNGWISVEDRLPDCGVLVLVYIKGRGIDFSHRLYNHVEGKPFVHDYSTGSGVTHWMPLPEPPEVDV